MTISKLLFIIFFTVVSLEAKIYEDAEDGQVSRWRLTNGQFNSSVKNRYDSDKKSHVIEFKGKGTDFAYELKVNKLKKETPFLFWEMKSSEDFVLIVLLDTNVGERYLIYTPGTFKGYMQYGLGDSTVRGTWKTIERNLKEDISYFDNRVKKVSIKSFVVKGNLSIDNLMTTSPKKIQNNQKSTQQSILENRGRPHSISKIKTQRGLLLNKRLMENDERLTQYNDDLIEDVPLKKEYIPEEISKPLRIDDLNNDLIEDVSLKKEYIPEEISKPLRIEIKGDNPLYLEIGEAYVEKGVTAYDAQNRELKVTSIENIDRYSAGRYMVLYMARDSKGNLAVDKRYVYIGEVSLKKIKKEIGSIENKEAKEEEVEKESEEDEVDELDDGVIERNLQIKYWEKELALKEKELALEAKYGKKN